jgi:hypothetical protein
MTKDQLETALRQTQRDVATLNRAVGTLIAWIAQSAGSPLSVSDAERLLDMLPPENRE